MEHNVEERKDTTDYGALEAQQGGKKGPSSLRVRCLYGLFLLFGFVLALIMRNNVIQFITKWMIEHDSNCTETSCIGDQSAYRVSFALFIFFLIHWVLSSSCNLCMTAAQRVSFNQSHFFIKLIAFIPLLIIAFVIPNQFFAVYAWFAVIMSIFFLLAQLIILLDFSYNWSEKWAAQEETRYQIGLIICAVLLFGIALTFIGLEYHWFGSSSECKTGQGMISMTLVAAVVYTFLSIVVAHGSVIPSGAVFIYTVWTCYSSLASGIPAGECNKLAPTTTSQILVAVVFCAISLVYTCINAANSRQSFQLSGGDDDEEPKDELTSEASNFTFFHVVMMLGSCYMAMLITGWDIAGSNGQGIEGVDKGSTPMWVKFGTEVACILLYLWTLVAPSFCGNREFE